MFSFGESVLKLRQENEEGAATVALPIRESFPAADGRVVHAVRGRARKPIIAWVLKLASGPNDKLRANLCRQCVGRP